MKRRINLIIGKKQIVIAGLTLILAVAVYVNYVYLSGQSKSDLTAQEQEAANYGEASLVSTDAEVPLDNEVPTEAENSLEAGGETDVQTSGDSDAYFAQARLDKTESRDEAKQILESMYNGGDSTSDELAVIAGDAVKLGDFIESESAIENLLKAQGFEDALCYLSGTGANIIVKTGALDAAGAAKIKNALLSEVSVPAENITIIEIN